MGKTFCKKHERFYETACEYCVPAAPVVGGPMTSTEIQERTPPQLRELPPLHAVQDATYRESPGRGAASAFDALKRMFPMKPRVTVVDCRCGKWHWDPAAVHTWERKALDTDGEHTPERCDRQRRNAGVDRARGPDVSALVLRTGDILDLRQPSIVKCACGRFAALSGTTIRQESSDGLLHTPEVCRGREMKFTGVDERFVRCFCGDVSFVAEAYVNRDMVHHSATMEHRPQHCGRPRAWSR